MMSSCAHGSTLILPYSTRILLMLYRDSFYLAVQYYSYHGFSKLVGYCMRGNLQLEYINICSHITNLRAT